uniref:Uncharacterized protein n=1 Tax=Arundo donax TaxID=35708 RepID=A0A0A9AM30_ARUDO
MLNQVFKVLNLNERTN